MARAGPSNDSSNNDDAVRSDPQAGNLKSRAAGRSTFHDYYHEKIIKANQIPIPEDEILDYIIDGISDSHLKLASDHARLKNFTSAAEMMRALKKNHNLFRFQGFDPG
ncbi:uncharacterized protein LOC105829629 [Monomorium pharaonis]|uniref:uncharacterized protein LOC105829629 n=1 Tax=Monomorium pharaonis TaxID=307658 RepID=UPI001747814E|nr:uncharacterized protein LOC105829629 [Monomorium pharaonis]